MVHEFLRPDGSFLSTADVAVLTPIDGDEVRLTVRHTVADSSGRLAGLRGSFFSVGVHDR